MTVTFYTAAEIDNSRIKFAVIAADYHGKWLFVRHKQRSTWEIPGGHREIGETVDETARRELFEETGATAFELTPLTVYGVDDGTNTTYGALYYAAVTQLGELPDSEIGEVSSFDRLPDALTYPSIQPALYHRALEFKRLPEKFILRTAKCADAGDFAYVLCESWKTAYKHLITPEEMANNTDHAKKTEQVARHMEADGALNLIAFDGDKPIGVCDTRASGELEGYGEIVAIYALAEYRGRGVGAALMEAALDSLAARGYKRVMLNTFEQNHRARSFYEKYGFKLDGHIVDSGLSGQLILRYVKEL